MGFFDRRKKKLISIQTESYNPRRSLEEHDFSPYDADTQNAANSTNRDFYGRNAYSRDNLSDVFGGMPYPEGKPYGDGQRGYERHKDLGYSGQHGYEHQGDVSYGGQQSYVHHRDISYDGRYGYEGQKDVFGQRVNYPDGIHTNRKLDDVRDNRFGQQDFYDDYSHRSNEAKAQVEHDERGMPQTGQYPKKSSLSSRKYEENGVIYYPQSSDTLDKGKGRKEEKADKKSFFPIFKGEPSEYLSPPPRYRRTIDSKLTIFLVENTAKVFENQEIVLGIVKKLLSTGFVCIINYGSTARESELYDSSSFDKVRIVCKEDQGDNACFYDALVSMKTIFDKKFLATEKRDFDEFILNKVDIVGIGTGRDNCSKASKEEAIKCFCDVIKSKNVTSKYFCLTEDSFMDVAEIGFRSIGAISKEY